MRPGARGSEPPLGQEETGRVWEPGDVIRNAAGSTHSFRAISDEPFVFVVAVHEGIRFTNR